LSTLKLQSQFTTLEDQLNVELVERRQEIRAALLALVSRVHVFYLGTPGTAKSLLVDRLHAYIGGTRRFKKLMTRFTTPEEIFGPVSLKALEQDEFLRKIDGYLPTVELAFIDEVFKANSSILNALLMAINEREYEHGNSVIGIPLSSMFTASNELPQDESLAALYDRMLFRFYVEPIKDNSNFTRMLKTVIPDNPTPLLTWADVEVAQKEAAAVIVPDVVIEALTGLRRDLKEKGIEPTGRRFKEALKIIRAAAWMDECAVADVEHLQPLRHVMWDRPEQQSDVDKLILALANPFAQEARTLMTEIDGLEARLDAIANHPEKYTLGMELHGKLKRAKKELDVLEKKAGGSTKRNDAITEVRDRLKHVTDRVLEEIFQFDPGDLK
jgi:MoxR-like ATPase